MFALVDCNSFYVSCERLFNPSLRTKPLIVLSNNDGCIISRSTEAKELGIPMGGAYFKVKKEFEAKGGVSVSSNYCLYQDVSQRVMRELEALAPQIEVYSIDEAFLCLKGFSSKELLAWGKKIKKTIYQNIGIPVSVGIAPTKVLAKMAGQIAKNNHLFNGVCFLESIVTQEKFMADFPIECLWGIGRKSALKLRSFNIKTALDFKNFSNTYLVQKTLTKTGRQIQDELRGISCLGLNAIQERKAITSTRSFGRGVYSLEELQEAIANYVTKAAEKLRQQQSCCKLLSLYIRTSPFQDTSQYSRYAHFEFPHPTNDTLKMIKCAHNVLKDIYRPGYKYQKAGVILSHLIQENQIQLDFFQQQENSKLIKSLDRINQQFGSLSIKSASCGTENKWRMKSEYKSKRYTTQWSEIAEVKCI